jgi:dTDP-4-amino-4,6-dideoxygalactose transaminase
MMSSFGVPFSKPSLVGNELQYVADCIHRGKISGDGPYTKKCELLLEQSLGVPRAMLTTSCTGALEMAALMLDIQPGDEVIVPSFTFPSTVNPFVLRGARPVFSDIRPDTLNLDETRLESLITRRTKTILVMHYAGVACEMDAIMEIADRHGVAVVEDNALGLFGTYKGRHLGTFGCFAAQSFHESKNFTCGEGGALLINDPQYIERAEIIREKGTNRNLFLRGRVDQYTWVGLGSSYAQSDILAAFLYAQLEARDMIQANRRRIWKYYFEHLRSWAQDCGAKLPFVPAYCGQTYNLFYLLTATSQERQALMEHTKSRGVPTTFHYLPLHLSRMGRRFGGKTGGCPVTELVSERLVRLPFHNDLSETDQAYVVHAMKELALKKRIADENPPAVQTLAY